jgi:hypothetical protein
MEMHHIRPRFVLSMPDEFSQEIRFFLPATWTGGLSALETIILLKLMRAVQPSRIFEFGTFEGETTRFLLANLPPAEGPSERIYTLDLAETENVSFEGGDGALAKRVLSSRRKYSLLPNAHLVKQLLQDSMHLDPKPYRGMFQFVFIDANHKLEYVRKDTENAFEMIGGSPNCVVWHDYGNPDFPELTKYLDDLAKDRELYHVGDTMLVFQLSGKTIGPG